MTAKYLPITPHDWMSDALCAQVDPDLWFPEKGGPIQQAKAICNSCPVRAECLNAAMSNNEAFGVWGGLSVQEMRKIRRLAA